MVLTRQEKEKLVLDLYNQGKTYREIAKDARMCPRDIGVIVNKAVKEEELKTDHKNDKENQDTNNSAEKKLKEQGVIPFNKSLQTIFQRKGTSRSSCCIKS